MYSKSQRVAFYEKKCRLRYLSTFFQLFNRSEVTVLRFKVGIHSMKSLKLSVVSVLAFEIQYYASGEIYFRSVG